MIITVDRYAHSAGKRIGYWAEIPTLSVVRFAMLKREAYALARVSALRVLAERRRVPDLIRFHVVDR